MADQNKPKYEKNPAPPATPAPAENPPPAKRGPHRWQKGQSGNPGGRPKEVGHVRELARQHAEDAIRALADIMLHGSPDRARVAAAEALLDRGFGRPEVAVTGAEGGPVELTLRILRELADQARGDGGPEGA